MTLVNFTVGATSQDQVTPEHLAGNYSFSFSNMTWGASNVVQPDFGQLGMTSLRYPGGAYTERLFDITNPNATSGSYINHAGAVINDPTLIGQDTFFTFCQNAGVSVTMIVPMSAAFTEAGYWAGNINRAIGPDWITDLTGYITATLADAHARGITIDAFELGNEYETFMVSSEYARVASASAAAIQAAVDAFMSDASNDLTGWSEPLIAVQVTNEAPEHQNYSRNDNVRDAFTTEGLAAIDAVVSHYYQGGSPQTELVEDLSNHFPVLWEAMATWDVATNRSLDRLITEWNVSHLALEQLGLRQIDPILDMFTNFMMNGVDMAHLWALQYNQNAMFDVDFWENGLTVAGNFVALMIDELPGKNAVDISETRYDLNAYAFADSNEAVVFVTSLGSASLAADISFGGDLQSVVGSQLIGIGTGQATNAPNATWETTNGAYSFGQSFTLDAYEVMMVRLNLNRLGSAANDTMIGTIFNDRLNGGDGNDTLNGGDGTDTLIGGNGNDTLTGGTSTSDLRDMIYGGAGDDTIYGGYGNDELRGDAGDDTITGGFGADMVIGGAGDDVLTGAAFSDELFGGDGMDFINGGYGHDRLNGGAGADRFYHIGVSGHGTDWVQDFSAAEGDTLEFGIGTADGDDFLVTFGHTTSAAGERAGDDAVEEAFVIYRPTGQVMWALVDGGGQASIDIMIGGVTYDLLG